MYTYITHAWVWSFRSGVGIVKTTLYYVDGDDDNDDDGDDDDDDDGDDDDDCGDGDGDRDGDGDGDGGDDDDDDDFDDDVAAVDDDIFDIFEIYDNHEFC